jgi:hypothetical protein
MMLKVLKDILTRNRIQSFGQAKAMAHVIYIQFYINIDHILLGKQLIANKYAPINTRNRGFIIENIEQNTLFIDAFILFFIVHVQFKKVGKSTTKYFTHTAVI